MKKPTCRIDSVFVSRYHALIVHDNGQDLLLDLGSTNGLLVNSRRILRRALRHRDLIQVGPARVMYLNEHAAATAQPDPGETICFARPGFPAAAGEDEAGALLAFGRLDTSGEDDVGLKPDLQRTASALAPVAGRVLRRVSPSQRWRLPSVCTRSCPGGHAPDWQRLRGAALREQQEILASGTVART